MVEGENKTTRGILVTFAEVGSYWGKGELSRNVDLFKRRTKESVGSSPSESYLSWLGGARL